MALPFSGFELEEELSQLRRDGEVQKLEPQVFDLLRYLGRSEERPTGPVTR